ncbi:CHAT domain-containing protein [Coleofasciculus sp. FACHB-1120]|nr:CHAT domain-containing protein [Coleofasciculus sp. FACHB-1120]
MVSFCAIAEALTSLLMTEFYQNLQENPDRATARQSAMLTILKICPNP